MAYKTAKEKDKERSLRLAQQWQANNNTKLTDSEQATLRRMIEVGNPGAKQELRRADYYNGNADKYDVAKTTIRTMNDNTGRNNNHKREVFSLKEGAQEPTMENRYTGSDDSFAQSRMNGGDSRLKQATSSIRNKISKEQDPGYQEPTTKKYTEPKKPGFWSDVKDTFGTIGKVINPLDDVSASDAIKNFTQNGFQNTDTKEVNRLANRTLDAATFNSASAVMKATKGQQAVDWQGNRKFGDGGGADMAADALGYLASGLGIAKGLQGTKFAANLAGKGALGKAVQIAKEGAIIGGIQSAAETPAKAYVNPDMTAADHAKNLAFNVGTGIVLDPILHGAGTLMGKAVNKALSKYGASAARKAEQAAQGAQPQQAATSTGAGTTEAQKQMPMFGEASGRDVTARKNNAPIMPAKTAQTAAPEPIQVQPTTAPVRTAKEIEEDIQQTQSQIAFNKIMGGSERPELHQRLSALQEESAAANARLQDTVSNLPFGHMGKNTPIARKPSTQEAVQNVANDVLFKGQSPKHWQQRYNEFTDHVNSRYDRSQTMANRKEFKDAVEQQYQYLKNSMGKGVEPGGVIRDNTGDVVSRYGRISNNPTWYQDFYRANGRKPNNAELRSLAEQQVKNGYSENGVDIPAWGPKAVKDLDSQIDEIRSISQADPEEGAALQPVLKALEQERAGKIEDFHKTADGLKPDDLENLWRGFAGDGEDMSLQELISMAHYGEKGSTPFNELKKKLPFDEPDLSRNNLQDFDRPSKRSTRSARNLVNKNAPELLDPSLKTLMKRDPQLNNSIRALFGKGEAPKTEAPEPKSNQKVVSEKVFSKDQRIKNKLEHAKKQLSKVSQRQVNETPSRPLKLEDIPSKAPKEEVSTKGAEEKTTAQIKQEDVSYDRLVKELDSIKEKQSGEDSMPIPKAKEEAPKVEEKLKAEKPSAAEAEKKAKELFGIKTHKSEKVKGGEDAMTAFPIPTPAANPAFLPKGKNGEPLTISRKDLLNTIQKELGISIRSGKVSKGSLGVHKYNAATGETLGAVRTKIYGDVQVISHEIGHMLDRAHGLLSDKFDGELIPLGQPTSRKTYTPEQIRREGIAEWTRLYLTDPQQAVQQAPNFSNEFSNVVPADVKAKLARVHDAVQTWIHQDNVEKFKGTIVAEYDKTLGTKAAEAKKAAIEHYKEKTLPEFMHDVYTRMVDRLHPLSRVEKFFNNGKLKDAATSLYKRATMALNAPRVAQAHIEEFTSILKEAADLGHKMKDIDAYLKAVHAYDLENMGKRMMQEAQTEAYDLGAKVHGMKPEQAAQVLHAYQQKYKVTLGKKQLTAAMNGRQVNLTPAQFKLIQEEFHIETGTDMAMIDETIRRYDSPEMRAVHKKVMDYNNKLLDYAVKHGIKSKEAIDAMREKYPNYVPFYRYFDEDAQPGFGGRGFVDLTDPFKRLKGSTRDTMSVSESIARNTFAIIGASEKNKIAPALKEIANAEYGGQFFERLDGSQPVRSEKIITVWEKGERVQYQVKDHELYKALKDLDAEQIGPVLRFFALPAQTLRVGATNTLEFVARNIFRDQPHAYFVSNVGYNPFTDFPKGFAEVLRKKRGKDAPIYDSWVANGGAFGSSVEIDKQYVKQALRDINVNGKKYDKLYKAINPKEWLHALQTFAEISEESTKIGIYQKALKKGYSEADAAYEALDTMNFGRRGNNVKQLNHLTAFLNANIQGKDKFARAFIENPTRSLFRIFTTGAVPAATIFMMQQALSNDTQRDTIDNAPRWMKDTNFLIPIPGTDQVARIPKSFEIGFFSNVTERMLEQVMRDNPDAWQDMSATIMQTLSIPFLPTFLTPLMENWANQSTFTGGSIVPRSDQGVEAKDRWNSDSSSLARAIGQLGGGNQDALTPYKIDNLIRGYTGGLGQYALSGIDRVARMLQGDKKPDSIVDSPLSLAPKAANPMGDVPLLSNVAKAFTVDNAQGGKDIEDFYSELDKVTVKNGSALLRGDDTYKEAAKAMTKASIDIGKLRKQQRSIEMSFDYSPEEKRQMIEEITLEMRAIARDMVDTYKE